jgi:agmatinase
MRTNSPEEAEIIIQKLPCDMGIHRNSRKGTLSAPEKILGGLEFEKTVLVDEVFPDEFDLEETQRRIFSNTHDLAEYGRPVISLGGDHSVSYPILKALKKQNPDLKLVWLDAHLDLKEKVDGNISHDVVVRQLIEEEIFRPEEIYFVGTTEIDHDEEEFLENYDFSIFRPESLDKFMEEFEGEAYLSIDIDVLREEITPGTGYPDGDLGLENVQKIIQSLNISYADLVEVAPSLDDGRTVKSAQDILEDLIDSIYM